MLNAWIGYLMYLSGFFMGYWLCGCKFNKRVLWFYNDQFDLLTLVLILRDEFLD